MLESVRSYLQALEAHSPFRFSYLRERRQKLSRRQPLLPRLMQALAAPEAD